MDHRRTGSGPAPDGVIAQLDVCDLHGNVHADRSIGSTELTGDGWVDVELDVHAAEIIWGAQFRVLSSGVAAFDVLLDVDVEPLAGEDRSGA